LLRSGNSAGHRDEHLVVLIGPVDQMVQKGLALLDPAFALDGLEKLFDGITGPPPTFRVSALSLNPCHLINPC